MLEYCLVVRCLMERCCASFGCFPTSRGPHQALDGPAFIVLCIAIDFRQETRRSTTCWLPPRGTMTIQPGDSPRLPGVLDQAIVSKRYLFLALCERCTGKASLLTPGKETYTIPSMVVVLGPSSFRYRLLQMSGIRRNSMYSTGVIYIRREEICKKNPWLLVATMYIWDISIEPMRWMIRQGNRATIK